MQFYWRDKRIKGHAGWRAEIAEKDDQAGRSAPTLAAAWSGPAELFAALEGIPVFEDLAIEGVAAEVQTSFDEYPGGKRNHDLVVEGTAQGGRVVVCVEAKAGETFGATVEDAARAAENTRASGKKTNAPERLRDLLQEWVPDLDPEGEAGELRYQLLTATAGTIAEGMKRKSDHAVLFIHEFKTDERASTENDPDLRRFLSAAFPDVTMPSEDDLPWCVELRAREDTQSGLHLAKAVTDLRPADLRG